MPNIKKSTSSENENVVTETNDEMLSEIDESFINEENSNINEDGKEKTENEKISSDGSEPEQIETDEEETLSGDEEDIEFSSETDNKLQESNQTATSKKSTNSRAIGTLNLENFNRTEEDKKINQKWSELYDNYSAKKTLQAEIVGTIGGGSKLCATAKIINYNEFNVYIPYEELDLLVSNNLSSEQKETIVSQFIGSTVSIVLTRMISIRDGMTASIKEANKRRRKKFFYTGVRTRLTGDRRVIDVGTIINNARILRIYRESVDIDVCGAITRLRTSDIFWQNIRHPKDYLNIGDTISVVVKNLTLLNDNDYNVKISCSHKELVEDTTIEPLNAVVPGTSYLAEVTYINKSGVLFLYCNMGFNAIATGYRGSQMPVVGSKVKFRAKGIDAERNIAVGIITQIIRMT